MNLEEIMLRLAGRTPEILGGGQIAKFSLLVPLIRKEDGIHVLFEVRALHMRRQPGEICFPGGRIDPEDRHPEDAAVRETVEELGLKQQDIRVLFPLDFLLTPFGTLIYSYAGFIEREDFSLNEEEVSEVFTVPLDFFFTTKPSVHYVKLRPEPEETFPYHLIQNGKDYNWQTKGMEEYFYSYNGRIIWGLTARILTHFIELLRASPATTHQCVSHEQIHQQDKRK